MYSMPKIRTKVTTLVSLFVMSAVALANPVIPVTAQPQSPSFTPGVPKVQATSYILMDATSGKILAEKDSDKRLPPASLTKLMSMYIISGAIQSGALQRDDKVRVSAKAWKTEGSRMFVKVGDEVPVSELIQGIVVVSGNDAAVAMAEHIAGTEESFANMMNEQAKLLGMKDSHFVDSTGLPNPDHYSTARDLALLTRAYINHFPEDYGVYSEKWLSHNGIKQPNRNRLLWRYQYADGLKTGHTNEAGYCLVSSAKKDGMRLIAVVLGEPNDSARTEDSIRLMTYGFRFFETHKVYDANTSLVNARVRGGVKSEVPLGITQDLYVTVPTGQYKHLKPELDLANPLKAPIAKGETYGTINMKLNDEVVASKPLVALDSDAKGGLFRRAADSIKYNFHRVFSKPDETMNTG